jgi:hypothetical protein
MPVTINGTTGIAGVDGSASTPAVQGSDTNTGVFYPAADTVAVSTGGSERMRIDSSGNVGIGTGSPNSIANYSILQVGGSSTTQGYVETYDGTTRTVMWTTGGVGKIGTRTSHPLTFQINSSEVARIDTSGQFWVGYSSQIFTASGYKQGITFAGSSQQGLVIKNTENSQSGAAIRFVDYLGNYTGGGIYFQTSGSVSYSVSSDYRLKENVRPMEGGLDRVLNLNPVTFDWSVDKSEGEGFLAHELQSIVPKAVLGEKDATDEEGSPVYQNVDHSRIIVHLVAAIKELSAKVDAQAVEIVELKAKIG